MNSAKGACKIVPGATCMHGGACGGPTYRPTSAPRWDLAAGRVPKWDRRIFARFCEDHDLSQAKLIRLMRDHGYPTMNAQQIIRWRARAGRPPRKVTIVALYNALDAVEAALKGGPS